MNDSPVGRVNRLARAAVICSIIGLVCVLVFLWRGFTAFSVGVGVFLGAPILLLGMVLYLFAVVSDLRRRDVL